MIQIPVLAFARFWRNKRTTTLKQIKHTEKNENSIPFKYYRTAIAAITRFHKNGNDAAVFKKTRSELAQKIKTCEKPGRAVILQNNLRAINAYESHFASRKFEVRPVPKLKLVSGDVVVSAKFDLHVIENGCERLVKLDMCRGKMNADEANSVLAITGEAAQQQGLQIGASNVLMLRLEDGSQLEGKSLSPAQRRDVANVAKDIEKLWRQL